jgi:hypothetical protein
MFGGESLTKPRVLLLLEYPQAIVVKPIQEKSVTPMASMALSKNEVGWEELIPIGQSQDSFNRLPDVPVHGPRRGWLSRKQESDTLRHLRRKASNREHSLGIH